MIKIEYKEENKDLLVTAKQYVKGDKGDKGDTGPAGAKGERGPAGVVVSDTEPTEALVWLIPTGAPSGETLTEEMVARMIDAAIEPYAKKTDIPEQPDLSGYALKTDIPDVSGYQTAEQVQAAINEALGVIENGTY